MAIKQSMRNLLSSKIAIVTLATISFADIQAEDQQTKDQYVFKNGTLERPLGYREWIYVGTPITPNDMNNGKAAFPEFHNVYIHPQSWAHWKAEGKFQEGTIIIKELVSVGSKQSVSGNGYFMGDFIGLEAVVKSAKQFPNEPGHWAFFSFSKPDHKSLKPNAKPLPVVACSECHQKNAKDDLIFTQHYPILRTAKGIGNDGTER